jgi:hypothetical protein
LELAGLSHHRHDNLYAVRWANRHAARHFYKDLVNLFSSETKTPNTFTVT